MVGMDNKQRDGSTAEVEPGVSKNNTEMSSAVSDDNIVTGTEQWVDNDAEVEPGVNTSSIEMSRQYGHGG